MLKGNSVISNSYNNLRWLGSSEVLTENPRVGGSSPAGGSNDSGGFFNVPRAGILAIWGVVGIVVILTRPNGV